METAENNVDRIYMAQCGNKNRVPVFFRRGADGKTESWMVYETSAAAAAGLAAGNNFHICGKDDGYGMPQPDAPSCLFIVDRKTGNIQLKILDPRMQMPETAEKYFPKELLVVAGCYPRFLTGSLPPYLKPEKLMDAAVKMPGFMTAVRKSSFSGNPDPEGRTPAAFIRRYGADLNTAAARYDSYTARMILENPEEHFFSGPEGGKKLLEILKMYPDYLVFLDAGRMDSAAVRTAAAAYAYENSTPGYVSGSCDFLLELAEEFPVRGNVSGLPGAKAKEKYFSVLSEMNIGSPEKMNNYMKKLFEMKYLEMIKKETAGLADVPEKYRTPLVCLEAVKHDSFSMKYIPEKLLTPEICMTAVKRNGNALQFVPENIVTAEMCLEAVKETVSAMEYVPEKMRTPELCIESIKYDDTDALQWVPEKLRTPEFCMAAVKSNGFNLKYVPENIGTPEICMEAVKQDGDALWLVPEKLMIPELCMEAVKQNGYALKYVPEKLLTPEICTAAVKQNGRTLEFVPEKLKTAALCTAAVKQNGFALRYALRYVPEKLKTAELCTEAVKQDGYALQYIPEKIKTAELCTEAVKQDGYALQYVPEELKTPELCTEAVQMGGDVLEFVPDTLKTPDVCMAAVKQNGWALQYVPEKMLTVPLCMAAVKQNGSSMQFVPDSLRLPAVCRAAVENCAEAEKYIPDRKAYEIYLQTMKMKNMKNRKQSGPER